ncbi:MAG: hypothetical protein QXU09_02375 [Thermoproteota archaeon]
MVRLKPPCEAVSRYFLPAFRSLIAKRLIEDYAFTQVVAAKKLGVTQATISHYLYSKRGAKKLSQLEKTSGVKEVVTALAKEIAEGKVPEEEVVLRLCEACRALQKPLLRLVGS